MTGTLRSILSLFENSLTVADLVRDQDLFSLDPHLRAERAYDLLAEQGFDQAPVTDAPIRAFVLRHDLEGQGDLVGNHARPIVDELRVPETTSMLAALSRLQLHEVLFVTHRRHVTGIVTRSDLGQPVVGLLGYGLITATEQSLDVIIVTEHGEGWMGLLPEKRQHRIQGIFEERLKYNAELDPVRALNLDDRLTLIKKCDQPTLAALGYDSTASFKKWKEELGRIRDHLMHGEGMLGAFPDPTSALEKLMDVHRFASNAADLAEDRGRSTQDVE